MNAMYRYMNRCNDTNVLFPVSYQRHDLSCFLKLNRWSDKDDRFYQSGNAFSGHFLTTDSTKIRQIPLCIVLLLKSLMMELSMC